MKKLIIIFTILLSGSLIWQSCSKDGDLLGGGDSRESFAGSWLVIDQCSKQTYGVDITSNEDNSTEVIIVNFANLGRSVNAIVAGNSITVEKQSAGEYTVNGQGKINGSVISWSSYDFQTDADETKCTAVFKK
ncbi:MAG: hypothetical protein KAH25_05380 [Bacteroidales bacterium]|nr:hypothetical protein [Bacteroidales bacterium]